jgi:hypothetical protein
MTGYYVRNLVEVLENSSEERTQKFLSSYSCPPNRDIESFLKERAILFSRSSSARTFIVSSKETDEFVGYFTLAQKSLVIEEFVEISKSLEKKIRWFSDEYRIGKGEDNQVVQVASLILIAHLGKNYTNGADKLITGQQLLSVAFEKITEIQREVGGRFVLVECEDNPNLLSYYASNGFKRLQDRAISEDGDDYFVQLVRTS